MIPLHLRSLNFPGSNDAETASKPLANLAKLQRELIFSHFIMSAIIIRQLLH